MKIILMLVIMIVLNGVLNCIAPQIDWIVRGVFIGFVFGIGQAFGALSK